MIRVAPFVAAIVVLGCATSCNLAIGLGGYVYQDPPPPSPGALEWWSSFGGTGVDASLALTTDTTGKIVVAACSSPDNGAADICGASASRVVVRSYAPDGTLAWNREVGDGFAFPTGLVARDTITVGGNFRGLLTVGTDTQYGGTVTDDVFLATFGASDGAPGNLARFGDASTEDTLHDLASDGASGLLLGGTFTNTIAFGPTPLVAHGGLDAFFAHLGEGSKEIASKSFTSGQGGVTITSVASLGKSDVVIGGVFSGTLDLGVGAMVADPSGDAFLARLDGQNKAIWSKRFGSGMVLDQVGRVVTDGDGSIYVTGVFGDTIDFGGAPLKSRGKLDVFYAKLDGQGAHVWSSSFGDVEDDFGASIAVDSKHGVVVGGAFHGVLPLAGATLVASGDLDAIILKLEANGAPSWARALGGAGPDVVNAVAFDAADHVLAAGYFSATASLGDARKMASGDRDAFVLKLMP